ncbi:MAG: outer membrane beta-barrel protein [Bacteroidales bacterium]|nr:outer membrane beta-barrel protein [Bacteroidales bacterium]MDD4821819.1 outer membrane beta-barrel protein [Bacteroidales bacterium]
MRKYLALLLFVFIATASFGQNNYQDVVYLKNGSIIRGVIIEQVINKSVKIETADKSVFFYQMDEIEKITKESPVQSKTANNQNKRKGYIGLSMGPSMPLGDFADKSNGAAKTGMQLNLINYGYLYSKNVGIAAMWFGASHPIDLKGIDPWSCGGVMVGPLFSFPVSEKVDWDIKPMLGYSVTSLPDLGSGTEDAASFAFNLGAQIRFHVSNNFSLLLSADYFSTKAKFTDYRIEQKINTLSFGFGVAYRLK